MSFRPLISAYIAFVFAFSSLLPAQALAASQPAAEVILIRDAHSDEAAQLGIAKLLGQITSREKIDFIALEGAWTRLTPEILEFSRDQKTNRGILLHLLKHGEISGADLFAVSSKSNFAFEGVEDKQLYKKYFLILKEILRQHGRAENFSKTLRLRLMDQSSRTLNPKLRDFIRHQEQFIEGNLSPLAYLEILKKLYREEAGAELTALQNQIEYPNILRVLALQKLNVSKQAEEEYKKFRVSAGPGSLRGIVEAVWDKNRSFPFSENLKSALRFHILEEELAGADFFTEIDAVSEKILRKLARTEKEISFLEDWQNARLFSKLLKLEISPEEWGAVKNKKFDFSEIASLDQQARMFYFGAELRDQAMTKNLLRQIRSRRASKVILITGGFHTAAIQKLLQSRGVRVRVITPERKINGSEGLSQLAGKISLGQYRDSILHTSITLPQFATMPKPDVAQPAKEVWDVDPAGILAASKLVHEFTGASLGSDHKWFALQPTETPFTRESARMAVEKLLGLTSFRTSAESADTYTQMLLDGDTDTRELEFLFKKWGREQKEDEKQMGKDRWDRRSTGESTGLSLGTKSKPALRTQKPVIEPEDLESMPLFQIKEGQKMTAQYRVHQHRELNNRLDQLARVLKPGEIAESVYIIHYGRQGEKFKKYELGFFLKTREFPNGTALSIIRERKKGGVILSRGILYTKGAATNRVYSPLTKTKEMLQEKILEEKIKETMAAAKNGKKQGTKVNGRSLGQVDKDTVRNLAIKYELMAPEIHSMPYKEWDIDLLAKANFTAEELEKFFKARKEIRGLARETGWIVGFLGYPTKDDLDYWSEQLRDGKKTLEALREEFLERAAVQNPTTGKSLGSTSSNEPVTWNNLPKIIKERYGLKAEIFHTFFTHDEQLQKRPFAIIVTPEEWRVHIDVFDQSPAETLTALEAELRRMRGQNSDSSLAVDDSAGSITSTFLNDPGQQISAHSLGAARQTAAKITGGLIDPEIAEKSKAAAQAIIAELEKSGAPLALDKIQKHLSSKSPLDLTIKILMPVVRAQERRPVLNIFTSDQLSEDVVNVIRYLHWLNPQEHTAIAITSPIPERMTAKIAAIKNVHMIRPEKIGERIDVFKKEFPAEDARKTITMTAPQFILDSLSNYSGVNFITPIAENAAFKTASTREKIGALLAERSVAHLLAYHRGDATAFEKLGLGGILTPANGHTEFAPRYDLNWLAIASSLGKLVDEWRGIEAMRRSA